MISNYLLINRPPHGSYAHAYILIPVALITCSKTVISSRHYPDKQPSRAKLYIKNITQHTPINYRHKYSFEPVPTTPSALKYYISTPYPALLLKYDQQPSRRSIYECKKLKHRNILILTSHLHIYLSTTSLLSSQVQPHSQAASHSISKRKREKYVSQYSSPSPSPLSRWQHHRTKTLYRV